MAIIITIDGWSACGKSTLAKQLAKKLGYLYIDSGAMYRASLPIFEKPCRLDGSDEVSEALKYTYRVSIFNLNHSSLKSF